jgi:hypothetical protein
MFMLGRKRVHKDIPKEIDISSVEPHLQKALELKGLRKKAIVLSKQMSIQELKRRNTSVKLNANNKKVDELFEMLDEKAINEAD